MKINYQIRKKREMLGYSQEYMALKISVSQKTYSRIEGGKSKIDIEKLKKICHIPEIEIIDLLKS